VSQANEVRPIEILLAEDSREDAELTLIAMNESRLKNRLHVVVDGVEALRFLRKSGPYVDARRPDLVILDLNMPRMGGVETLQEIKKDPDLRDIPIAVLTSSKAESDISAGYRLPMDCLIPKPLTSSQFIAILQSVDKFGFAIYVADQPEVIN